MTYSDKKVDHKKYIKGEVDLLRHVARPLLALFDTLTVVPPKKKQKQKKQKQINQLNCVTSIRFIITYLDASMK